MDQILADTARRALEAFHETKDDCAHLCGCKRASSVVDSTIYAALHLGGWSYRTLANQLNVSPSLIQKRAERAAARLGG